MLYLLENTDYLDEIFLTKARPFLSQQRCQKMDHYKNISDRINAAAVFLLLRYALLHEYHINECPDFVLGEYGKPFLKDLPQIHFSFSHCRNAAVCIVSDENTAADISDIRRISPATVRRVCSEEEIRHLSNCNDKNTYSREFFRLWTQKECLSKLCGKGLSMDFRTLGSHSPAFSSVKTIEKERYILSYYARFTDFEPVVFDSPETIWNGIG